MSSVQDKQSQVTINGDNFLDLENFLGQNQVNEEALKYFQETATPSGSSAWL